MKKDVVFGLVAGFAAGAAAAIVGAAAVTKVSGEIKRDLSEQSFVSPNGDNRVTLTCGTSETAKKLTYIKVKATTESKEDGCEMVVFTKKGAEFLSGEWTDNDHFELLIGNGKRKQCCDVSFDGDEIVANYYLAKLP